MDLGCTLLILFPSQPKYYLVNSPMILSGNYKSEGPANQTEESEVWELSGKESRISSGTPLLRGFV